MKIKVAIILIMILLILLSILFPFGLGLLPGLLVAGAIHWSSWRLRQGNQNVSAIVGGFFAAILFIAVGSFLANPGGAGEIIGAMQAFLVVIFALTLLLGVYQSKIMKWPYLQNILSLYVNAGMAIILTMTVGYRVMTLLHKYTRDWRRVEIIQNSYLFALIATLLILEIARPLLTKKSIH